MGDGVSGSSWDFGAMFDKGMSALGTLGKGLFGGSEATGQNQFYSAGKDGTFAAVNAGSAGAQQAFKDGKLTPWGQQNLTPEQINSGMGNMKDGNTFDLNKTIGLYKDYKNMKAADASQKREAEYFAEWKKNNAYMKQKNEEQQEARRDLGNELRG